jgi:hypothetical protein
VLRHAMPRHCVLRLAFLREAKSIGWEFESARGKLTGYLEYLEDL